MATTLYSVFSSHPGLAAHLALAHKGIDHRRVNLTPGLHAPALRLLGFAGSTVPALVMDGRRIQGSVAVMRELDHLKPEPPLFPSDPASRARVEEAERWGEAELQPFPRRLFAWLTISRTTGLAARRSSVAQAGLPLAGPLAAIGYPIAWYMADRVSGTQEDQVKPLIATLPGLLDRVEEFLSEGTIGGDQRNAADFQIATTVRLLLEIEDLRPHIESRPVARYAYELLPDYPFTVPAGLVPPEWLSGLS